MQDSRVPSEYAEASVLIRGLLEPLWDITEDSERLQKTLFPKLTNRLNEIRLHLGDKNPLGPEEIDMDFERLNQLYPALVHMLGEDALAPNWISAILESDDTGVTDTVGQWSYQRALRFVNFRRFSVIHTHVFLVTWRFLHDGYLVRLSTMSETEKQARAKRIADPLGIANDIREAKMILLEQHRLLTPVLQQLEKYETKKKEIQSIIDSALSKQMMIRERLSNLDPSTIQSILAEAENRPGRKLGILNDFSDLLSSNS